MQAGRYLCNVPMHLWLNFGDMGWWACLNRNINLMVMMVTNTCSTSSEASLFTSQVGNLCLSTKLRFEAKPKLWRPATAKRLDRFSSSGNQKSNLEVMHLQVALKSGDIWPFDSKKWHIQSLVIYQSSPVCCTNGLTWKNILMPDDMVSCAARNIPLLFPYLILRRQSFDCEWATPVRPPVHSLGSHWSLRVSSGLDPIGKTHNGFVSFHLMTNRYLVSWFHELRWLMGAMFLAQVKYKLIIWTQMQLFVLDTKVSLNQRSVDIIQFWGAYVLI